VVALLEEVHFLLDMQKICLVTLSASAITKR